MSLILNPSKSKCTLSEHLSAFVKAAQDSSDVYSVQQLQEMVKAAVINEAGGIVSWFKRAMTGMDGDLVKEIKSDVDTKIKTKEQQEEALKDIDTFIGHSNSLSVGQIVLHCLTPWMIPLLSYIIRTQNESDGSRAKYKETLQTLRKEIAAKKFKD